MTVDGSSPSNSGVKVLHHLIPPSVDWLYLSTSVYQLDAGETVELFSTSNETVVVLVSGAVALAGGEIDVEVTRTSPFVELATVAYYPPRVTVTIFARAASEIAVGMAPADGRFPARLVHPHEMASTVLGGDAAMHQVVDSYGLAFEAERIICYESWVPRGGWAGWPPHRHDGLDGSPYLEGTYYYHFDQPGGFGLQRNFDRRRERERLVPVVDGSLVPVPSDYHVCAIGPVANAWLLNFLAGAPEDRVREPRTDAAELWITDEWNRVVPSRKMRLPAVDPRSPR